MNCVWLRTIWLSVSVLFGLSGIGASLLHAASSLSADEVIQKAVARGQQPEPKAGQPGYTYTKVTLTEELDTAGNITERKEKVYQICLQSGSTRAKLLSVNGRPPGESDLKKAAENEMNARQLLGQSKSNKSVSRDNFLVPEVVARFDFTLLDQRSLNGRAAYRIAFAPKSPEPPERRLADRLLNRITGTLWIDAQEFELAQADIRLGSEVNLLGGIAGSLRKLSYTMTRTRVADGLWLSTATNGDFEGRKLLVSKRIKTRSQSANFRPLAMQAANRPTG